MNKKKKWITIASCVVAYILYAIFTGGVVIYNTKDFGGQRNIVLAEGLKSDLWIDSNFSGGGIPFIGFYHYTRLPCSLRVQIWDDKNKYSSITIETILVIYADDQEETINVNWRKELEPYTQVNSSSKGIIRTSMLMLSDNTPKCIKRYMDCDVKLIGFLTTLTKEKVPFKVVEHFEHEADFGISTFWEMIAGI